MCEYIFILVYVCFLSESQVTFVSLQYLTEDDIKSAIRLIGLSLVFGARLFEWKKETVRTYLIIRPKSCLQTHFRLKIPLVLSSGRTSFGYRA